VFLEATRDHDLVRVQWRSEGRIRTRSWRDNPDSRDSALRFARAIARDGFNPTERQSVTVANLWDRFVASEFPHLRLRTRSSYGARWAQWLKVVDSRKPIELVSASALDELVADMRRQGRVANQIRLTITLVKGVFRWARSRNLIDTYPFDFYRFKARSGEPSPEISEYRLDEAAKILKQLNPAKSTQWRPWAVLNFVAHQGTRASATLNLRWADIDLAEGVFRWPAQYDKLGRNWVQPIRAATRASLDLAAENRRRAGYSGPWVFFSTYVRTYGPGGRRTHEYAPYSLMSLYAALRKAEERAGVCHGYRRALHGFRRMVAGEVFDATKDVVATMEFIGDRDITMAQRYIKRRIDRVRWAAGQADEQGRNVLK
jgi:integrase